MKYPPHLIRRHQPLLHDRSGLKLVTYTGVSSWAHSFQKKKRKEKKKNPPYSFTKALDRTKASKTPS
jgi:hypothetical protein